MLSRIHVCEQTPLARLSPATALTPHNVLRVDTMPSLVSANKAESLTLRTHQSPLRQGQEQSDRDMDCTHRGCLVTVLGGDGLHRQPQAWALWMSLSQLLGLRTTCWCPGPISVVPMAQTESSTSWLATQVTTSQMLSDPPLLLLHAQETDSRPAEAPLGRACGRRPVPAASGRAGPNPEGPLESVHADGAPLQRDTESLTRGFEPQPCPELL